MKRLVLLRHSAGMRLSWPLSILRFSDGNGVKESREQPTLSRLKSLFTVGPPSQPQKGTHFGVKTTIRTLSKPLKIAKSH